MFDLFLRGDSGSQIVVIAGGYAGFDMVALPHEMFIMLFPFIARNKHSLIHRARSNGMYCICFISHVSALPREGESFIWAEISLPVGD